jgi:hypothetical protein
MSITAMIIALGITASVFTSVFVIAAAMLSSRISRGEGLAEHFESDAETPQLVPTTAPVKSL